MENIQTIDSVCTYCGVGCDIAAHVDVKENKIKKYLHILTEWFLRESFVLRANTVMIL